MITCRDEDDADRDLVARVVASNDSAAFGRLVARHQSRVRGLLRRLARDEDLADDLAQDCFMHAWSKMHSYSGRGTVIGWLLKIAYTTFLQSKRRSKRYSEILEQIGSQDRAAGNQVRMDSDEISDLDRFLAVLEEEDRAVLALAYVGGLSHREIADVTSQPIGTVKSIIFRAKEKIRTQFDIHSYQHG